MADFKTGVRSLADLDNNQNIFLDTVDAAQKGVYDGISGIGETFGLDSLKGWADEKSEQQIQEMSLAGREALNKSFVQRDEFGALELGDAATDARSWTMNIAHMLGANADVMFGAGAMKAGRMAVTAVVNHSRNKLIAKGLSKEVATKIGQQAGETYAKTHKKWAQNIVDYGAPAHAVYGGMQASDVRDEVNAMDIEDLMQAPVAQEKFELLKRTYPDVEDERITNEVRRLVADDAANNALLNPTLIAANMLFGGLQAKMLEKLARGSASKTVGVGVETVTETAQEGLQKVAFNQTMQDVNPNVELSDGVAEAALTGGILGAGMGGSVAGARTLAEKGLALRSHAEQNATADESLVSGESSPGVDPSLTGFNTEGQQPESTAAQNANDTLHKPSEPLSRAEEAKAFLQGVKSQFPQLKERLAEYGLDESAQAKITSIIKTYSPLKLSEDQGDIADAFLHRMLNSKTMKRVLKTVPDDKKQEVNDKIATALREFGAKATPVSPQKPASEPAPGDMADQAIDFETGEVIDNALPSLARTRRDLRDKLAANSKLPIENYGIDEKTALDAQAVDPESTARAMNEFEQSAQSPQDIERLEARVYEIAASGDATASRLAQFGNNTSKQQRKESVLQSRFDEDNRTSAQLAMQSLQPKPEARNPFNNDRNDTQAYLDAEQRRREQADAEANQEVRDADYDAALAQHQKQMAYENNSTNNEGLSTKDKLNLAEKRANFDRFEALAKKLKPKRKALKKQLAIANANGEITERLQNALGESDMYHNIFKPDYVPNGVLSDAFNQAKRDGDNNKAQQLAQLEQAKDHELSKIKNRAKRIQTKKRLDQAFKSWLADDDGDWSMPAQAEPTAVSSGFDYNSLPSNEFNKQSTELTTENVDNLPAEPGNLPVEPENAAYQGESLPVESENASYQAESLPVESENASYQAESLPVELENLTPKGEHVPVESEGVYVEDYSDKSLVIRGDTKRVKSDLSAAGFKFNARLKGGPGWIAPKSKQAEVEALISRSNTVNAESEKEGVAARLRQNEDVIGKLKFTIGTDISGVNNKTAPNSKSITFDEFIADVVAARLHGAHGHEYGKHRDKVTPDEYQLGLQAYQRHLDNGGQKFNEHSTLDGESKSEGALKEQPANRVLLDAVAKEDLAKITKNHDLKALAVKIDGKQSTREISSLRLKQVQEAYETVSVINRRQQLVSRLNDGVKSAYDYAVEQYQSQPKLDVRTKNSSDLMAYSTPTPMSLLANLAAGVDNKTRVYEPTAGNGLLILTADPKNVVANELDPIRADNLAWTGFDVTTQDATNFKPAGKVDAVLANPPFGALRDGEGKRTRYVFNDHQGKTHSFGELDHVIAKSALDSLKDNGKATLILGAPKEPGDYKANNKAFLNWLYNNYNIAHHVEAEGNLYSGQGAAWPTQMIVVHGRAKTGTGKYAPIKGDIKRVDNWAELYETFNELGLLDAKSTAFNGAKRPGKLLSEPRADADQAGGENSNRNESDRYAGRNESSGQVRSDVAVRSDGRGQRDTSSSAGRAFDSQPDIRSDQLARTNSQAETVNTSNELDERAGRNDLSRTHTRVDNPQARKVERANPFQAVYKAASDGFNDGVLTPVNMASYTQAALANIASKHGSVDKYVQDSLGYNSIADVHKAFMALQVDAAALAIDNIEQGRALIIGDQTGVGKGRQAAAVMRYAMQQKKVPIFVTQKPNLFTDMVDDLADIGVDSFTPLIMNADGFISKNGSKLHTLKAKERSSLLSELSANGKLPDGFDALFLTYSQISSDQSGKKTRLLSSIVKDAVFVLDESHTAAGSESKLGKAFQGFVDNAHGVAYLSATYAKRPDNMLLYSRTDLGLAAENKTALVDAVVTGGLGMQTYIAGKLAEAGQMVRRERSFDGININNRILTDNSPAIRQGFDEVTKSLRAIQDLSAAWARYVKSDLAEQIQRSSGLDTNVAGNKADTAVNVTLFSSVVHNYIAQLSLGLKAKHVANLAVEAIKAGKRPVIALENTMGSALTSYMDQTGKRVGDKAQDMSFAMLLEKVADGVLAYSVKSPGERKSQKVLVPAADVQDSYVRFLYEEVQKVVKAMNVTDVPASPIDAIRYEIAKQGYSVAEITGRDKYLDYGADSEIINKPVAEKDRRAVVDNFNSGKLDVLILNQAGSTGLSLHAKEGFPDVKQRHMIVAQPSLDINTFMQMLGRTNRTGQVVKPSYDLAWLDLPSEKRPAAVLARKMTSLNANTSGNKDSATSVDSVDMLNVYGDHVVKSFVDENYGILREFNDRLVDLPEADEAMYFLGKLAVLPVQQQESIYSAIEAEYKDYIGYLDATGQNELDTTELDLQAKPIEQKVVSQGRAGAGVFAEDTYVTKVEAKAKGKAPKWAEVEDALKSSNQANFDASVERLKADTSYIVSLQAKADKLREQISKLKSKGKKTDNQNAQLLGVEEQISAASSDVKYLSKLFSEGGDFSHGAFVRLDLGDAESTVAGVVTELAYRHEEGHGNPAARSKWEVTVMLANRARKMPLTLKKLKDGVFDGRHHVSRSTMAQTFDRQAEMPDIETRFIMTGNLIEAQSKSDQKGRIVPFTTHDGRVIQGMLMPESFTPENNIKESVKISPDKAAEWLKYTNDSHVAALGIGTVDNEVTLSRTIQDNFVLSMPKSVTKGKRYWGDPRIESIIGEQAVKGTGALKVTIPRSDVKTIIEALHDITGVKLKAVQVKDYKQFHKIKDKGFGPIVKFSKTKVKPGSLIDQAEMKRTADAFISNLNGAAAIKYTVLESQAELPNPPADGIAQAEYQNGHVYLVRENIGTIKELESILREEVIAHHGLNSVMNSKNYRKLIDRVIASKSGALKKQWADVEKLYADFDQDGQAEEVIGKLAQIERSKLGIAWTRIKSLLVTGLRHAGLLNSNQVSKAEVQTILDGIARAMRNGDQPSGPTGGNNNGRSLNARVLPQRSKLGAKEFISNVTTAAKNFKLADIPKAIKSSWENNRKHALKFAPRRMITELASTMSASSSSFIKSLQNYDARVAQMEASRNELINRAQEVADVWRKAMGEDSLAADDMANLMHDATLAGVDPSDNLYQPAIGIDQAKEMMKQIDARIKLRNGEATFIAQQIDAKNRIKAALKREQDGSRESEYDVLRVRYLNLPDGLKGHFVERVPGKVYPASARRSGTKVWEPGVFEQARDVYRAQNIRRVNALVERIEELIKDGNEAKALGARIREEFEMNEIDGVYFPLNRFGDYVGMVIDDSGELVSHSMFESYGDLKKWQAKQVKELPNDYTVLAEKRVEMSKQLDAVNPKFMNNVVNRLKGFGTQGDRVRDEIYQLYLESLPEMSARKQQMHRKGVAGFSADAMRAYAHNTFHGAYNVARLENTHHMESLLEEMRADQKFARDNDNDESFKMSDIINEMQRRHEWILNPQGSAMANTLTNLGFMWYLGATPAAALLNITQTPILALPIMGAKYGWGEASKQLAIASKEFISGKGHAEKKLAGYEKMAFDHFLDSGLIDKTLAHDLSGLAEGGVEYSPKMHKFTEVVAFMFHHTERFNREVTALAAYRMAAKKFKAKGLKAGEVHEKALAEANDITYKAHFDYSNANKARFMQSDTAKVLLLFRQHSLNMTWRLIRDVQQAIKGRTPQERSEARKQLAGILGMTFIFAGAVGLPLFSMVMGMLNLAFDDEDEPFDADAQVRSFVTEHLGADASALLFKGVMNTLTGADVSSRTSLNNLWLRDPDPSQEGEAVVQYYAEQALGPIFGIALGFGRATQLWREGYSDRAAEAALPKSLRDGLKAIRYHQEGVSSYRGDAVVEDTSLWQEALQATGWTPHEVSEVYGQNRALKGYERQILNRRKRLMNRYALGVRLKDSDLIKESLDQIKGFNSKNKTMQITPKQLAQSIHRRKQLSDKSINGVILNDKMVGKQGKLQYM
ncbi:PLxRFG domain-containing protein [Pseudoalteromonas sp. ASV78]|uniref:PLxRFG domain-containing protein n=1 Tax=Pseudoalteromonas sp. ASV78 TaxID=3397851 RepID=UPI0039FD1159